MKVRDKYIEINKRIFNLRDGAVLEMQTEYGAKYKKSLGVSVFLLKEVAKEYDKSNELADLFWIHGGREQLLMAMFLTNPETIDKDYLEKQLMQLHTPELWEQVSMTLLKNLPNIDSYITDWLQKKEEVFHILAILLQGQHPSTFTQAKLQKIISVRKDNDSNLYLRRCQHRIFIKIAINSYSNYKMITQNLWIKNNCPLLVEELDEYYE